MFSSGGSDGQAAPRWTQFPWRLRQGTIPVGQPQLRSATSRTARSSDSSSGRAVGSERGLTVFWRTDNFEHTNQVISMIRGGGATGRAGFAPGEPLPSVYAHYDIEILRDRVAGKWNVQAALADASEYGKMLAHTALQAKLRGLI
jgi:hypothetical protein